MDIDASFYKNVYLLMQLVPASCECTKFLKKGMFDKPNTSGFIHISHYLLDIYDAKCFERMVTWPIMNKMDEKNYRIGIKGYLEIIANDNPDISFPPVLMSHLLHAGGLRILTIMWKISQISLRTYITRSCQMELLLAPRVGVNKDIITTYLTTKNLKKDIDISKCFKDTNFASENFKHYMKCKSNDLAKMQTNIFEAKENLMKFVATVPVNPIVVTRLMDFEDTEIINLWKQDVYEKIEFLREENSHLNKLENLSNALCVLIFSANCRSFNGDDLTKVKNEIIPLCFANNKQHFNYGLYTNGCLVFHNLVFIFNEVLEQLQYYLKMGHLLDLTIYESKIIEHCKTMKIMETQYQKFIVQISDILCSMTNRLQERNINTMCETETLSPIILETTFTSPKFNFHEYVDDEKLFKQLYFSPLQGKHKYLFKRHKCTVFNLPKTSETMLQLNNSIDNITINWKSPQTPSSNRRKSPNELKVSPKYSRLFSPTNLKRSYIKSNAASTPNRSPGNKKSKKIKTERTSPEVANFNNAMKQILDLSYKITKVIASLSESQC